MNRTILATFVLVNVCLFNAGHAQQFERNSAANIFGPDGPQVPVYAPNRPKPDEERRDKESDSGGDPEAGARMFLEQMCKQVGPKSSACAELAALNGQSGSAATGKLGFDPGEAAAPTSDESDAGFGDN